MATVSASELGRYSELARYSAPWADRLARSAGVDEAAIVLCLERPTAVTDRRRVVHEYWYTLPSGGSIAVATASIPVVDVVDLLIGTGFVEVRASSHRVRPFGADTEGEGEITVVLAQATRPVGDPAGAA